MDLPQWKVVLFVVSSSSCVLSFLFLSHLLSFVHFPFLLLSFYFCLQCFVSYFPSVSFISPFFLLYLYFFVLIFVRAEIDSMECCISYSDSIFLEAQLIWNLLSAYSVKIQRKLTGLLRAPLRNSTQNEKWREEISPPPTRCRSTSCIYLAASTCPTSPANPTPSSPI